MVGLRGLLWPNSCPVPSLGLLFTPFSPSQSFIPKTAGKRVKIASWAANGAPKTLLICTPWVAVGPWASLHSKRQSKEGEPCSPRQLIAIC